MTKITLAAVLFLTGLTAQARSVEIKCKPNPEATSAQFIMVANLVVADDETVSGAVKYATRSTATAQTSEIRTITVSGKVAVAEAGEIKIGTVTSYQLIDESDELVRIILNPDLSGPTSSTLMIDRKFRYSSQCKVVKK